MKMQTADYAWVIFATIILAVLMAGWRLNDANANLLRSAHAATPTCKSTRAACETMARVARSNN